MGRYKEAVFELQLAVAQNKGSFALSWLGCLLGIMGEHEKAKEVLNKLQDMSINLPVGNFDMAIVYAGISERNLPWNSLKRDLNNMKG